MRHEKQGTTKNSPDSASVADEIRKFVSLRDDGYITDDEFNAQKARLLEKAN